MLLVWRAPEISLRACGLPTKKVCVWSLCGGEKPVLPGSSVSLPVLSPRRLCPVSKKREERNKKYVCPAVKGKRKGSEAPEKGKRTTRKYAGGHVKGKGGGGIPPSLLNFRDARPPSRAPIGHPRPSPQGTTCNHRSTHGCHTVTSRRH